MFSSNKPPIDPYPHDLVGKGWLSYIIDLSSLLASSRALPRDITEAHKTFNRSLIILKTRIRAAETVQTHVNKEWHPWPWMTPMADLFFDLSPAEAAEYIVFAYESATKGQFGRILPREYDARLVHTCPVSPLYQHPLKRETGTFASVLCGDMLAGTWPSLDYWYKTSYSSNMHKFREQEKARGVFRIKELPEKVSQEIFRMVRREQGWGEDKTGDNEV
ncbi:MAG: hypothetical protein M1820_005864 [Bogoriella megaspora]|nr:MAG: hypothetical protein M1820_005864 [Bogoriella megaspora]